MKAHLFITGVLGVLAVASGCDGSNGEMPSGAAGSTSPGAAGTGSGPGTAGTGTGAAGTVGTVGSTGAAGIGSATGAAGTGVAGPPASLGDCAIFPPNDDWNTDISGLPVDATWTQRINTLVGAAKIHPDFGDGYGIPINVVPASQPAVPIVFNQYPDEADPGPYPFPGPTAIMIEGGTATTCAGDCHVLVVQTGTCMLYEGYACKYAGGGWQCGGGAKWDLKKVAYGQRPDSWTSADASGMPIMPGILRYAEAAAGPVKHAVRFTLSCTLNKYVKPASHQAGGCSTNPNRPPMGLRVRLKASFTMPNANPIVQNILTGLQHYGMLLADNGSNFYFQGDPTPSWTDAILNQLKAIPASAFEVVAPSPLPP